jgi:hypothetical protein
MNGDRFAEFRQITTIIERDSKDTTYKFALLRGVIEICQEHEGLAREVGPDVEFPLGLLVEKWILYYYPLVEPDEIIPQKSNGEGENCGHQISFRKDLKKVTDYYRDFGGLSAFYRDYISSTVPEEIERDVLVLMKRIRSTITDMPMRHLGHSLSKDDYSIFRCENGTFRAGRRIDQKYLIAQAGTFRFRRELFDVFRYLGSYISGEDSLLYKWAKFSAGADKSRTVTQEHVLARLKMRPETGRAVADAKDVYLTRLATQGSMECVWSGREIRSTEALHVDHAIPFSLWQNNELWNLLPATDLVNQKKGAGIPGPALVEKRADSIVDYWHMLHAAYPVRFMNEMAVSLIGRPTCSSFWEVMGIDHLREKCGYLIDVRGFDEWKL